MRGGRPAPLYDERKIRSRAPQNDIDDISDIIIDMGAAVESVVIVVIVVTENIEAGQVRNETLSCLDTYFYDSSDSCDSNDGKKIDGQRKK